MTQGRPRRSWWNVRWRQFRNAPRPVVRAVGANLVVAGILGAGYLAYDVALTRGAVLPGGDLRILFATLDVILVLTVGSLLTYLIVPLPRGAGATAAPDGLERRARAVRRRADRLPRARRGRPGAPTAADLIPNLLVRQGWHGDVWPGKVGYGNEPSPSWN